MPPRWQRFLDSSEYWLGAHRFQTRRQRWAHILVEHAFLVVQIAMVITVLLLLADLFL